jgi:signal transduction histidine kinase/ligand-binding sensor domain-containing protein
MLGAGLLRYGGPAFAALAAIASQGAAQQDNLPVGALDHAVWSIREGAPAGIHVVRQTADGVLWLGTNGGLYRFDGVHFEPFEPRATQTLSSLVISQMVALPDSTLWIGYGFGGVSMLAHGQVVSYGVRDGIPLGALTALAADSVGDIWASTTTGLAYLHGGRWHRVGAESGFPGAGMTSDLVVDRRGTLWATTSHGVFVLARGAQRFTYEGPPLDANGSGYGAPRVGPDGSVWGASTTHGLIRLTDSAGTPLSQRPAIAGLDTVFTMIVDRRRYAWMETPAGLVRVRLAASSPQGRRPLPGEKVPTDGEPGAEPFEDRDGNVWVATLNGLERFRETKLTPLQLPPPLIPPSVVAAPGGAVWIGGYGAALLATGDQVIAHPEGPLEISCAYRDFDGGLWFGGTAGIWYAPPAAAPTQTRFTRVAFPEESGAGEVQAIARSLSGDLWVSIRGGRKIGVFRRQRGVWSLVPLPAEYANRYAQAVVVDSADRIWLGYTGNRLLVMDGDSVRAFTEREGLRVGTITALVARGTRLWISGELGVALLEAGRIRALTATEPLRGISGLVETDQGDLWLNGATGITHVAATEVRRAVADSSYRASGERFDDHDGLIGRATLVRPVPTAVEGTDRRLWFTTERGLVWIDPQRIRRNPLAPLVQIRSVQVADKRYDALDHVALPPRTTQMQIDYSALSLAEPERVRFRYRLSGVDTSWVDVGTRRQAFYTSLKPASYRFQVIAANEDGVWNDVGARVGIEIPPTFTETKIFKLLIVIAVAGAIVVLALWRQRQLSRAMRLQFEAQLAERSRVARELHDTLLSDMAGVALQLSGWARRLSGSATDPATVDLLSNLGARVRQSLVEARRSVTDMRTRQPDDTQPLHARLASAAGRAFEGTGITVQTSHGGSPRKYRSAVETEILSIANEALTNARRHANCRSVSLTCDYAKRALRVSIRDDGRGFSMNDTAPAGHWGLVGMRERATSIGAVLSVTSAEGTGTEVALVLPERARWWAWATLPRVPMP